MNTTPTEDTCRDCRLFTFWSGPYGGSEYPACAHRDAGTRSVTLLDEMDSCPKQE